MILVDANLLIYAHVRDLAQHAAAKSWLDRRLNDSAPVGMAWQSLTAFLRIVSNPRIFERPEPIRDAWRQVTAWLDCPTVWVPQPTEHHRAVFGKLVAEANLTSALVPDAHLAALAIEHGLILCSTDGDFARFADLKWQNPI